jgi:hypothetical protein
LLLDANKVPAGTLLLNQQDTLSKQINKAASVTQAFYRFFKTRYAAARDTKDFEELVMKVWLSPRS